MKVRIFFAILSVSSLSSLYAQSSGFSHPLQVEPITTYNKIKIQYGFWDKRILGVYEENRNIHFEGEYKFWSNFSILGSFGRSRYSITDTKPEVSWDRLQIGIKYAKSWDLGGGQFVLGGGIRAFDQKRNAEIRERENPDYYQIRPNIGIGYMYGRFQILSELRFQTETNRRFRESELEEFRRYYQLGIAPSFAISDSLRIFSELEYREPFNKTVDTKTRFANLYPGLSFQTETYGAFAFSLQVPLLNKDENSMDRGWRFSYFYFFDTVPKEAPPEKPNTPTSKDEKTEDKENKDKESTVETQ
ncbi:hypothetical protein LPTSP4_29060 [Leptospira ryugenii]|uniref:Outer membrane protein n=1 Tax=Leptospira ryugenii TaxID=1917863 RepID=A0A2P2E3B7_9LEPT|nr:hypothetical protein [Leptospira ryugenii]GBF51370.1 hypothetical protein LPTSP4_29060 [Leptospira ryugenii]